MPGPTADTKSLPGVSFVVPIYNKARYLPKVLAAIKAQRGGFTRQFVFVDDGSSDNSLDVLRRETKGWPGLVIERQENQGSAGATNRGIARANQPFVKFVDADDLLAHDATQVLLRALAESDACLAFGDAVRFTDPSGIDLAKPLTTTPTVRRLSAPLRRALKNSLFNPTQFLARTECLVEVEGCDENIVHSQEYSLTLRLAHRWDFLEVDAPVAYLLDATDGRLSSNQARQLQRVTRASASFVHDHPDVPRELQLFACRRAATRAWHFARRHRGAKASAKFFSKHIAGRLGLTGDAAAFIETCATVYDARAQTTAGIANDQS